MTNLIGMLGSFSINFMLTYFFYFLLYIILLFKEPEIKDENESFIKSQPEDNPENNESDIKTNDEFCSEIQIKEKGLSNE